MLKIDIFNEECSGDRLRVIITKVNTKDKTMTVERWDDERLDRFASAVESLTGDVQRLTGDVQSLASQVQSLTVNVESNTHMMQSNGRILKTLADLAAEAREERRQLSQRIDRQQAEIAGLRTETNRLLDLLLNERNQRNGGDSPTT